MGIFLNHHNFMYKVLAPSIITPIKFLWRLWTHLCVCGWLSVDYERSGKAKNSTPEEKRITSSSLPLRLVSRTVLPGATWAAFGGRCLWWLWNQTSRPRRCDTLDTLHLHLSATWAGGTSLLKRNSWKRGRNESSERGEKESWEWEGDKVQKVSSSQA